MPTPPVLFSFSIGTSIGAMTNLEQLEVPLLAPHAIFKPYQKLVTLGDLSAKGIGYPSAVWTWGVLTDVQRDQLREFCSAESAEVYITTPTNDNQSEYKTFLGKMVWPPEEENDADARVGFSVAFIGLVEVEG